MCWDVLLLPSVAILGGRCSRCTIRVVDRVGTECGHCSCKLAHGIVWQWALPGHICNMFPRPFPESHCCCWGGPFAFSFLAMVVEALSSFERVSLSTCSVVAKAFAAALAVVSFALPLPFPFFPFPLLVFPFQVAPMYIGVGPWSLRNPVGRLSFNCCCILEQEAAAR